MTLNQWLLKTSLVSKDLCRLVCPGGDCSRLWRVFYLWPLNREASELLSLPSHRRGNWVSGGHVGFPKQRSLRMESPRSFSLLSPSLLLITAQVSREREGSVDALEVSDQKKSLCDHHGQISASEGRKSTYRVETLLSDTLDKGNRPFHLSRKQRIITVKQRWFYCSHKAFKYTSIYWELFLHRWATDGYQCCRSFFLFYFIFIFFIFLILFILNATHLDLSKVFDLAFIETRSLSFWTCSWLTSLIMNYIM